jgi:hypothetical protein
MTTPSPPGESDAERQDLLQRDVLLVVTAMLSLLNGMHFSPFFDPAFILLRPFAAGFFVSSPLVLLYLTSIFVSLSTLLIGGIPAALYERLRGLPRSTPGSLGLWAAGVALLASPTLLGLGGIFK